MTTKLSKHGKFSARSKPLSLLVLFFLTILSIYLIPKIFKIKTQYSLDQFQPLSSPLLKEDSNLRRTFQLNSQTPLIAELKTKDSGSWLTTERLKTLSLLSKEIQQIDGVQTCTSITTVDTAIPDQNSFYVGAITDLSLNSNNRKRILQNSLIVPHLLSKNGKSASLIIDLKRLSFDQQQIVLKKITLFLNKKSTFFNANIGGPAAITITMSQLIGKEVVVCTLISLFVSLIFLFLLFKNISVVFASALIILYSNIIGLGMLWVFDLKLTVLTSTLPTLITLTVIAIAVQTFSRVAQCRHKVLETHKNILLLKIISSIIGSSLLASLTTVIGFATLITSNTPIMSEYGLSVSIAIMVASLTSLLMLSSLLVWMPIPQKRALTLPLLKKYTYFFAFKKHFLATAAIACLIFLAYGTQLNWSSRLFDELPQQDKIVQTTQSMEKTFGGLLPMDIMITVQKENFWKNPENIKKLDVLKQEFLKQHGVGSVVALSDFFKLASPTNTLPKSKAATAETYLIYSMAQENPLDKFLSSNAQSTRMGLKFLDIPSNENHLLVASLVQKTQLAFPQAKISKGGIAATVHKLNKSLSQELVFGAFVALAIIFVLLVFMFKSIRWSLVAMLPNMITPLSLIGILGISGTPIKPSLAIVFAISLGISFDNTIYVLNKLRKLVARNGNKQRLPILSLMRQELIPCLESSSAILSGFTVFLFSSFSINKTFGIFMILSLTAGLIGDLVLLPVLLHFAPGLLLKPINVATINDRIGEWTMKPTTQRYIALFIIITSMAILTQPVFAKPHSNANALLKDIAAKNEIPNEEAKIRMKIQEADGSKKERLMTIKKKSKKEKMALVRLLSPNDLKGVGLLTLHKGTSENQWLYLPSEKRSRRIVGSNSKGRFLDSEITYEDMRAATYENFKNSIIEDTQSKNKDIVIVESIVKNPEDSVYGKIKTWVDTKQYRLIKTEYYTPDGQLLKVMTFDKYKKYNNAWRAQSITVKNVQKNRSTVLELEKLSTKNINDDDFTVDSLEEG